MTRRPLLGVTLPQFTGDRDELWGGVERARAAGLDSIWVFDHLWPLSGGKQRPIFECWTTLAWLAARTDDLHIGTLVTRSSLRHPALLAKMAATVAEIAPGRLTVAIGSGDEMSRPENEAFGIPFFAGDDRAAQLRDTAEVFRRAVARPEATYEGTFVSLSGLPTTPRPPSPPRMWLGGRSADILELAGQTADGWNGWGGGPKGFARDGALALQAAEGRPFELSWGGVALVAETDDAAYEKLGARDPAKYLVGGPATAGARLRRFVEAGADHIILTCPDAAEPGVFELIGGPIRDALEDG